MKLRDQEGTTATLTSHHTTLGMACSKHHGPVTGGKDMDHDFNVGDMSSSTDGTRRCHG